MGDDDARIYPIRRGGSFGLEPLERVRLLSSHDTGWTSRILQGALAHLVEDADARAAVDHARTVYTRRREHITEVLAAQDWHVERGSVAVHSQTQRASALQVAAMVEGAIRHDTTMSAEGNYVDFHGQSEIG